MALNPQPDRLEERIFQNLEDMIRIFCPYRFSSKYSNSFSHDWVKLIPEFELAYKTSIYASTGKPSSILEKEWNPKLTVDILKEFLIYIHPAH
ncbi:hypothetical protein O181_094000 [Austropuccinia psidii MF-1]|uniref:Uncharacterized protein n=1 Tax=Austropuccinia psidii MF-1 TaxID=1389203 RepID=A0A9Q3PAN3_9BASI|nr:hypothetical protein [Austropuccinia psidii MF-1]